MKIWKLEYSEFEGTNREWKFDDCTFGDINLIVGKNAVGKTRTLNVINGLANFVSKNEELKFQEGKYHVEFLKGKTSITYILEYLDRKITKEILKINKIKKLERDSTNVGSIYSKEFKKMMGFEVPSNRVAVLSKRDSFQHPFIEDLYMWGKGIRRYNFGTPLGQDHLIIKGASTVNKIEGSDDDINNQVVKVFINGIEKGLNGFVEMIMKDMGEIGYGLEDVGVCTIPGLEIVSPNIQLINAPTGIYVKEKGLSNAIFQNLMSQGMFRALSLLIQINYSLLSSEPTCIVIDDISEGLDYGRSSALIKILIKKAKNSSVQLIMATNDRFVMNSIPLEYWIILERKGGHCIHYNYRNSKEMFDRFETTGLNNFDLFSTGYFLENR